MTIGRDSDTPEPVGDEVGLIAHQASDSRAAQQALADSERRFRLMAENATDVVLLTDLSGDITWVSPATSWVLGYDSNAVIGVRSDDLVHPDDLATVQRGRETANAASSPVHFDLRVRDSAGEYRWMSAATSPVFDADGECVGRLSTLRDIDELVQERAQLAAQTEQLVRAKAELQIEKDRLDLALIGTRLGCWDWDLASGDTQVDGRVAQILGHELGDLLPFGFDTWSRLVHDEDFALKDALLESLANIETPDFDVEVRMRHRDGRWVWIRDRGKVVDRDERGAPTRMTGTIEDIDELVRARNAARLERARLRATMDSLLDSHTLWESARDDSGHIVDFVCVDANPVAGADHGIGRRGLIGASLLTLLPGEAGAQLVQSYRSVVDTGEPLVLDDTPFRLQGESVEPRFYDIRVVRVGDGLSSTWRDVTDRHNTAAALATARHRYRVLAENATDGVCQLDADGNLVWASPSFEAVLGWNPQGLVGTRAVDWVHSADVASLVQWRQEVADGVRAGEPARLLELRVRALDGSFRWVSIQARPVINAQSVFEGTIVGLRDVHDEALAKQALSRSESRYRLLAENASDVVWQLDNDYTLVWASPSLESVLGWRQEELLGTKPRDLVHPEDRPELMDKRAQAAGGVNVSGFEFRVLRSDGEYLWASSQMRPVVDAGGGVVGVVVGLRDVHQQVLARENLVRSERMFRLAMDGAPQGMAVADLSLRFVKVNDALCDMLGRDEQWLLDHGAGDVLHPDALESDLAVRDRLLAGQAEYETYEGRIVTAAGETLWVQHSIALIRDDQENPLFYVSQFQDISAARAAEADLRYRAEHDTLTGLINRDQLQKRLTVILGHPPRHDSVSALLFCDLDFFKRINDEHGHAFGDDVLRITAERVAASVRVTDEVARLGGDEFVVVLPEVSDLRGAVWVAEKLRAAVAEPLTFGHHQITTSMSVGVALAASGMPARRLLRNADAALYGAKNAGRDQVAVFGED